MPDRCRLCAADDRAALIEYAAEALWESRRHGSPDDRPWETAGEYWKRTYRELATTFVGAMQLPAQRD